jgi:hypothetical protein
VFTITEYPSKKFIIPTSDNFSSVSTVVFPDVLSINDFSDSSKWDISVNQKGIVEGSVINTSIRIDRNTGQIWYSRTFPAENGITISEDGIGNCEKINMKKKKF